jgi:uncharacterized alkaline shock family protein YloU
VEGQASISTDILASYAADAACEVEGVTGLAERPRPGKRGVRVLQHDDDRVEVQLHLSVAWGVSIPDVGRAVQERVCGYLRRMADLGDVRVDVVVDHIEAPE